MATLNLDPRVPNSDYSILAPDKLTIGNLNTTLSQVMTPQLTLAPGGGGIPGSNFPPIGGIGYGIGGVLGGVLGGIFGGSSPLSNYVNSTFAKGNAAANQQSTGACTSFLSLFTDPLGCALRFLFFILGIVCIIGAIYLFKPTSEIVAAPARAARDTIRDGVGAAVASTAVAS